MLHNLPNSNETSTRRVADHALVPCAIEGRGYRALFIAQFIPMPDGRTQAGAGAVDTPLSGRPGVNVSEIPHNGSDM